MSEPRRRVCESRPGPDGAGPSSAKRVRCCLKIPRGVSENPNPAPRKASTASPLRSVSPPMPNTRLSLEMNSRSHGLCRNRTDSRRLTDARCHRTGEPPLSPANQLPSRPRSFLVSARRRFDSTSFAFVARERFALRLRSRAASARRSRFFSSAAAASFSPRRFPAVARFTACDRESDTVTRIPLGTWRSVTAVETLFTCCPPRPARTRKNLLEFGITQREHPSNLARRCADNKRNENLCKNSRNLPSSPHQTDSHKNPQPRSSSRPPPFTIHRNPPPHPPNHFPSNLRKSWKHEAPWPDGIFLSLQKNLSSSMKTGIPHQHSPRPARSSLN